MGQYCTADHNVTPTLSTQGVGAGGEGVEYNDGDSDTTSRRT